MTSKSSKSDESSCSEQALNKSAFCNSAIAESSEQHIVSRCEKPKEDDIVRECINESVINQSDEDIIDWKSRLPIDLDGSNLNFEYKSVNASTQPVAYRPDTLLDGWSTSYCTVRAASLRGMSHRYYGKPRQDDVSIKERDDTPAIIIAVADGVSNASHSHIASTVATRYITQLLYEHELLPNKSIDWAEAISQTSDAIVNYIQKVNPDIGDREFDILKVVATTIICAVIYPSQKPGSLVAEITSVGDSGAWIFQHGKFTSLFGDKESPEEKKYDGSTFCLPASHPVISTKTVEVSNGSILLLGTDGFGDPLGDGSCKVGKLYTSVLSHRVPSIIEFGHILDFRLKSFMDDRTLVAVWPKHKDI
jgi:serine/threonine protein phosphatase PrpC